MLRRKGGRSTSSMTKAEAIRKRAGRNPSAGTFLFIWTKGRCWGLIRRVAGEEYASRFRIRQRASESGMDEYDLYCEGGHVCIDATSGVAAGGGVQQLSRGEKLRLLCRIYHDGAGRWPPKPPLFAGRKSERSVFSLPVSLQFLHVCLHVCVQRLGRLGRHSRQSAAFRIQSGAQSRRLRERMEKSLLEGLGYTGKQIRGISRQSCLSSLSLDGKHERLRRRISGMVVRRAGRSSAGR